jgi:hypothetical protein
MKRGVLPAAADGEETMTGFAAGQSTPQRRRPSGASVVAASARARSGFRARLSASIGLGAIVALSSFGQALAMTSYTDPIGDALFHAAAYADIVAGSVEEDAGTFEFIVTVAESIPETPGLAPPGVEELRWAVTLDLDPTTAPAGYPGPPVAPQSPLAGAAEGFIAVAWNGSAFSATWYDRRPLLSGGDATATAVPFDIDGDMVHVWLDGALIGDPTSFRVGFVTVAVPVLPPNLGYKRFIDWVAPFYNAWP